MTDLSDAELRTRFASEPDRAWVEFVDRYTPWLVRLIRRTGMRDHDEVMDVYTRVCERLSDSGYARLRKRQPGSIESWLAVVVRHAAVDWVRSRAGRRRLFAAVGDLDAMERRVFELYYWDERTLPEIASMIETEASRPSTLGDVFGALGRIDAVLTTRHRRDLLSTVARARATEVLDGPDGGLAADVPSEAPSPEQAAVAWELRQRLETALRALPAEDGAIARLHFEEGLSLPQVRGALRLVELTADRVATIVERLRARLLTTGGAS